MRETARPRRLRHQGHAYQRTGATQGGGTSCHATSPYCAALSARKQEGWRGCAGRMAASQGICVDEMLVAEPTMCEPIYGHKGHVRLRFDIKGEPARSSLPHLGKNAIAAAAALTTALFEGVSDCSGCRRRSRRRRIPPALLPGPPTLTPTQAALASILCPAPPV